MILFDFDGVLVDSVDEVIATTYYALKGQVCTTLAELPPSYVKLFRANRYHVQPAADLVVLGQWCLDQKDDSVVLSHDEYSDILAAATTSATERREKFFATRQSFVAAHRAAWLTLNRVYQPLWNALATWGGNKIVILTNKNRSAVVELCAHFGIEVNPNNVFSGDGGATKQSNFKKIQATFRKPVYFFIDDSVHNLKEMKREFEFEDSLSLGLATWGYTSREDTEDAARQHFQILTQQDLITMLHL